MKFNNKITKTIKTMLVMVIISYLPFFAFITYNEIKSYETIMSLSYSGQLLLTSCGPICSALHPSLSFFNFSTNSIDYLTLAHFSIIIILLSLGIALFSRSLRYKIFFFGAVFMWFWLGFLQTKIYFIST